MQSVMMMEAMPSGIPRSPPVYLPLPLSCFGWSSGLLGETSLVKDLKKTCVHMPSAFLWLHCSASGQQVTRFLLSWPQYLCGLLHSSTLGFSSVWTPKPTLAAFLVLSSAMVLPQTLKGLCFYFNFLFQVWRSYKERARNTSLMWYKPQV